MKKKHHYLLVIILVIFNINANASVWNSFFGGGGSSDTSGTSNNPYELIVNGTTRNDDEPDKYYKFYSAVDQNITAHISDHTSTGILGGDTSQSLSLKLYATNSNNDCNISDVKNSTTHKGNFDWNIGTVTGGKFYCLSTSNSDWSSDSYNINITGDSALKAAISDASANEDDGNITFIIGLIHAAPADITISYTFHDHTAKNGVNYNGTNGTITIPTGQDSAMITVNIINTHMSTTKDFTITISSSSVSVDDTTAMGTIIGSSSVSGGGDSNYHGPDICYDSRAQSGFCMFGSCMFYQETTNIRAMVDNLSDIDVKKSLTRGIAFMDFASGIGIDGNSKTMQTDDDQAEKKSFVSADFLGSSFFNASMFPKGLEYRIGTGADSSQGGSLDKNKTASYYDKSLFKFGLFTQYTHIVTYKKNGTEYQEVLQACNPDASGSLAPVPSINQCGVFLDALNSKTKITFDTSSGIWQTINNTTDNQLNTPNIQNTNNTALCGGQACISDGIGSRSITLPAFRNSTETANVNIPYSMVIAQQQIGDLTTTTDSHTNSSENNRTIVFEAPYSPSYDSRVMFIHSITDYDTHADTYHYVFKEGDYWINNWDINKAKNITIETVGNVRFFINNNFTIANSGALNIGHRGSASSPKFYMYIYGNFTTNVTGATAIQNGYIYTKGTLTLGSTSTIALDWGALTADEELKIQNGASSTFNYAADDNDSPLFEECTGGGNYNSSYPIGIFNIIEPTTALSSIDPIEESNSTNDIYTKVISKDFNISLIHLADDNITLSPTFHGFVSINVQDTTNNTALENDIWHHSFDTNIPTGRYEIINLHIPKVTRVARFKINFLNWDKILANSNITCVNHSTIHGNLPGVPSCLDSATNLHKVFGARGDLCLNDSATGAPCKSSHHGIGNSPYDKNDAGSNKGYGCALCLMSAGEQAYSRDNFAIRPYTFVVFGKNQYKRAGENFNITIKAVNEGNFTKVGNSSYTGNNKSTISSINTYDDNISNLVISSHFYQPTTAEITQMQTDIGGDNNTTVNGEVCNCPNAGIFTLNDPNLLFSNGEINESLKFSETGILDLNISEKPGFEWAKIDENDTNDFLRYIKPSSITYNEDNISANILQLFVPYEFNTTAEYNTTTTKNWLYMYDINKSNNTFIAPLISAFIKYKITALNKNGAIVRNYTKKCFPDVDEVHAPRVNGLKLNTTFDLFLDMDLNATQDANISLYTESNTSNAIWTPIKNKSLIAGVNQIQEWISPFQFESGVGEAKVYFNIDRNLTTALNPVSITVIDTNTSTSWMTNPGSPAAFNGMVLHQNKVFLYGRTHTPKQTIIGSDGNVSMYYEIFCNGATCNKALLPDGIDSNITDDPRWFINTKHSNIAGTAAQTTTIQKNASNITITREANGNHPDYIGLHYNENSGYPYKVTMQNSPSKWLIYNKYNPNTSTNEFEVDFIKPNAAWAGEHETNTTTETNASKRTNRRIMW